MPVVELPEFKMHYAREGSGEPVVLIHGLGDGHEAWDHQVSALAEANFETFAIDLRGHGQSEKTDAKHSLERFAEDVASFMDMVEVSKAHIIGLSMGGHIAQLLALNFPEKIQSLTLIGTVCELKPRFLDKLQVRLAPILPFKPLVKQFAKRVFWKPQKEWVDDYLARVIMCGKKDFLGAAKAIFRFRVCDRLGEITVPTLVMVGEHDSIEPVAESEKIHSLIAGSTLTIIKDSGHGVQIEQPDQTTKALLAFLTGLA
ncbi:MAG: alpha/beta fold hydrolase [Candidatus Heimdallarchaeota archaeon]